MAKKHGDIHRYSTERAQRWIDAVLERADNGEPDAVRLSLEMYGAHLESVSSSMSLDEIIKKAH